MPLYARDGGIWKPGALPVRDAGVWKTPVQAYARDAGVWRPFLDTALEPGLYGFGINNGGRTGQGISFGNTTRPSLADAGISWTDIAGGHGSWPHFVGVRAGRLYGWGYNTEYNLGNGSTTDSLSPSQIGSDTNWVKVAAGNNCSFAIKSDGTLFSCGSNANGRTGRGTTSRHTTTFSQIGSSSLWTDVAASSNNSGFVYAINGGQLYRWGNGITTPTLFDSDTDWQSVSSGNDHYLFIKSGGLYVIGSNENGKTGLGTTSGSTSLVAIPDFGSECTAIAAGFDYSLVIKSGALYACGNNGQGATGLGTTSGSQTTLAQVGTATDWIDVAAMSGPSQNARHSLGIRGGNLCSWGDNSVSQLGDGTTTASSSPIDINSQGTWSRVATGRQCSMAILEEA